MPQTVEIPDQGIAEFPDEMSPEDIKSVIQKKFFAPKPAAPAPISYAPALPTAAEEASGVVTPAPTSNDIATNAIEGLVGTVADFVPRSLGGVLKLLTPIASLPEQTEQAYGIVKDVVGGKSFDEASRANFPEGYALEEADKTPAFSKERFKAGFGMLGQIAMIYGGVKGLAHGSLTETVDKIYEEPSFQEKPVEVPPVAEMPIAEPQLPASEVVSPEPVRAAEPPVEAVMEPTGEPQLAQSVSPPEIVYHQTASKEPFAEFKPQPGKAEIYYFSTRKDVLSRMIKAGASDDLTKPTRSVGATLDVQRPLDLREAQNVERATPAYWGEILTKAGVEIPPEIRAKIQKSPDIDIPAWQFLKVGDKPLREAVIKAGYDAVKFDEWGGTTTAVFTPDKIKLKNAKAPNTGTARSGEIAADTAGGEILRTGDEPAPPDAVPADVTRPVDTGTVETAPEPVVTNHIVKKIRGHYTEGYSPTKIMEENGVNKQTFDDILSGKYGNGKWGDESPVRAAVDETAPGLTKSSETVGATPASPEMGRSGVTAGETAAGLAENPFDTSATGQRLTELQNNKPRPINKLYGPNPTEAQAASQQSKISKWNSEYRKAQKAHKDTVEKSNEWIRQSRETVPQIQAGETEVKAPQQETLATPEVAAGVPAAEPVNTLQSLAEANPVEKPTDATLGIRPSNPFTPKAIKQDLPAAAVPKAFDPKIEARWKGARLEQPTFLDRARQAAITTKESFTRHFAKLDPKTDGAVIDTLRLAESIPQRAQLTAVNFIRGNVEGLGPKKYEVFSRVLILRDLIKDVDRGLHAGKSELPFGYKSRPELEADLAKFDAVVQANPDIKAVLDKRQQVIHAVRDEMVKRDLLPEGVKDFDDYFHRQVLQYYAMKEPVTSGAGRSSARVGSKGFQKGRVGAAKDFNTNYIEAEYEVLSQSFSQMEMQDSLAKLKTADVAPQLKAQAANLGVEWKSLVPDDHTVWQPERGNYFYPANTLADKALEGFLKGTRELTADDFKKGTVIGSKRPEWVIPKRLAETLDNFGAKPDSVAEKFAAAGVGKWKIWTLLNPFRAVKYNLNNLSGDLDIALAYDPAILKGAPQAIKDGYNLRIKDRVAKGDMADMQRLDVIGSGFSVKEVPSLGKDKWFQVLEGKSPNLIERYWNSTKDFTQFREDVLRIAAYRHFLDKINKGESVYGASKKAEIDAVTDPKEKAAKLSRELIGDYGNISVGGQWLRTHMIPFYSWMEINAPRYVRLIKNLPDEGRTIGTARVAGILAKKPVTWAAKKGTSLALKASSMYLVVNLWNRTFFSQEESELTDADRGQLHLILGRDDTGRIRSLRFQGALSDAMSWFGGENLPQDIAEVRNGKASIKDKALDAMKAPLAKVFNATQPIYKSIIETLTGKSLYPDPLHPRPIRDKAENLSRVMSVDSIYRRLAGKPTRPVSEDVLGLLTYTTDPGEAAYFAARSMVQDFAEKNNKETGGGEPTKRSNALYYHKQAVRFGDKEKADKFLKQYRALGGDDEGLRKSIKAAHPLSGIKESDRSAFLSKLSPEDRAITMRAEQWYKKVYKP